MDARHVTLSLGADIPNGFPLVARCSHPLHLRVVVHAGFCHAIRVHQAIGRNASCSARAVHTACATADAAVGGRLYAEATAK
jgi:hypothetical protein